MTAFTLCGELLPTAPRETLDLWLDCNGVHRKHFVLQRGCSFNLRFDQPLMLPRQTNVLHVRVKGLACAFFSSGQPALRFSHAVVEGEMLAFG